MAVSMAFAGSETTAITLSAVFYYLLKSPSSLNTLLSEIDTKAREGYFKDNTHGVVTWTEYSSPLPFPSLNFFLFPYFPSTETNRELMKPDPKA